LLTTELLVHRACRDNGLIVVTMQVYPRFIRSVITYFLTVPIFLIRPPMKPVFKPHWQG